MQSHLAPPPEASLRKKALATSDLSPSFIQSEIRFMTSECSLVNGINMAQGVCDTDPPSVVAEAAIQAVRDGHNIYTRLDGIASLRQAISEKCDAYNGIKADPETEVLVASGATGALYSACLALLNPGDEVILFEPFYGYHVSTLLSQRLVPVSVPLQGPQGRVDAAALRSAITPRTRAILLNTPCNPSGKVFARAELEAIADIAIEEDLFVFSDEIYEYFLYSPATVGPEGRRAAPPRHISIASLPGMEDRTVTISGFSKTFSVTGWRLGYLTASSKWMGAIGYFHDLTYVCAPAPLQHGAAAGLARLPASFYSEMAAEYQVKRDLLCSALVDAGMAPSIPDGAYYVLADASRIPGRTAKERARRLLKDTGIAAVAGTAFFSPGRGEDLLRFCFAKKDADLEDACRRLRAY